METNRSILSGAITVVIALASLSAGAQATPSAGQVKRTDLQRHDLSTPGHETIQARVDFPPGVTAPNHKHPGEEIIYVLEGSIEYKLEGKAPVILKAGDVLFVPYGVPHSAKNAGKGNASELATYVVEKGKPLVIPVQ